MLVLQKSCHAVPANLFSNAGMKDFNGMIIDLAANCTDAIAIGGRFIEQTAQEFRALRWQSKRDCNHQGDSSRDADSPLILFCRRLDYLDNETLLFGCSRCCSRGC